MILGFKPRNHPQQVAKYGGACDDTDDRRTPHEVFDAWNSRYHFTLDAAASDENALCAMYCTREHSGLDASWDGHRVWCNPPYSNLVAWVAKADAAMRQGACECVVMLLPANRTEQRWWQDLIEPYRDDAPREGVRLTSRFLRGRMRFSRPGWTTPAKGDRPPFGIVILTWERIP